MQREETNQTGERPSGAWLNRLLKKSLSLEKNTSGAEAHNLSAALYGAADEAAEKVGKADPSRTEVRSGRQKINDLDVGLKASTTNESHFSAACKAVPLQISGRRRRESGAMLLAVLFMMAMMVIVALAVAPALVQQAKRDREEEMIHRGTEYARAIKKYYKKFGRYPGNLEQLENTNQMRFLRRRFNDPLTKNGEWKLLHYADIASIIGVRGIPPALLGAQGGTPGTAGTTPQSSGATVYNPGAGNAPTDGQLSPQQQSAVAGDQSQSAAQPSGGTSPFASGAAAGGAQGQSGSGPGPGQGGDAGGAQGQGAQGQSGSNNTIFGNTGVGGQTFGGGAVVGVASKSKDPTIRIFNKKKTYDEWVFIYSPMMDRNNVLLRGPFNGQTFVAAQVGTPAGELSPDNLGNKGAPGVQLPNSGQQNPLQNQQLTPGGQFPPDQSQPQPQ